MTERLALKTCRTCGKAKPADEYHRQASAPDGRDYECRICSNARQKLYRQTVRSKESHRDYMRAWKIANPEKYAAVRLRARLGKYGLTPDQYMAMLLDQAGRCAACGSDDPGNSYGVFGIDHDHTCCAGKFSCGNCVRGLLCNGCNATLGNAGDDIERLEMLIAYLKRASGA